MAATEKQVLATQKKLKKMLAGMVDERAAKKAAANLKSLKGEMSALAKTMKGEEA